MSKPEFDYVCIYDSSVSIAYSFLGITFKIRTLNIFNVRTQKWLPSKYSTGF